ncbi:MAG TPA: helix-turn-helix domain-containing protein [Albitalea sp.]|uniref:winged helix-turn-helix transcriptional regulator n=1 Tax=Piscinibacter sp. TaxID=1903157 RepID=UPI002ED103FC
MATQAEVKQAVNATLELFQRKWLLRVIWELHLGPKTFRALQEACDELSPTVVNARLGDLREAGLVETVPGEGYALTALGEELVEAFTPLMKWGVRWQRRRVG